MKCAPPASRLTPPSARAHLRAQSERFTHHVCACLLTCQVRSRRLNELCFRRGAHGAGRWATSSAAAVALGVAAGLLAKWACAPWVLEWAR